MYAQIEKLKENKSRGAVNAVGQKQRKLTQGLRFIDSRNLHHFNSKNGQVYSGSKCIAHERRPHPIIPIQRKIQWTENNKKKKMTEKMAKARYGPNGTTPNAAMLAQVLKLIKFQSTFEFTNRGEMETFAMDHGNAPFSSAVLDFLGLLNSSIEHSPKRAMDIFRKNSSIKAFQDLHRSKIRDEVAATLPTTRAGHMMWDNAISTWTTENNKPDIPNSKYKSTRGGMARFAPINQHRASPNNTPYVKKQTLVADSGRNVLFFPDQDERACIREGDQVIAYEFKGNNTITIDVLRDGNPPHEVNASLVPIVNYLVCDFILNEQHEITKLHPGHAVKSVG